MTFALTLALAVSAGQVVDLFKDKGDMFIKAGSKQGLKVGDEVKVLGDPIGNTGEYRSAGSAVVMEVWGSLARVSLDEEAKKHAEAKLVELLGGSASSAKSAKSAPAAKPEANVADAKAVEAAVPPVGGTLQGKAMIEGFGPMKQVVLTNNGKFDWTNCDLRLPTNMKHHLPLIKANGGYDTAVLPAFKQDGVVYDRPLDRIIVKCDQGSAVFSM
jgi:hypothetical protein